MNGKAIQVTILSLKPGFEDMLIPEMAPLTRASRLIAGIRELAVRSVARSQGSLSLIRSAAEPS